MTEPHPIIVTLKRSGIGRNPKQRATLQGLGLTKLHKRVVLSDTPVIRGMLSKVIHLVDVRRAPEPQEPGGNRS
jgi:large subunit ribosomal protein L30